MTAPRAEREAVPGRLSALPTQGPRIASLVPSATETLVALGLGPRLVARTGFCIHPAEALRNVPKVGGTKDVNLAKLRAQAPTHVVLNPDENRRETAAALVDGWDAEPPPTLIITHPCRPEDNLQLFEQLRAAFADQPGVNRRAAELSAGFAAALQRCRRRARPAVRVLYLIWREPWMTVARDTYLSTLLAEVGWQTWPNHQGGATGASRYPTLSGAEPWLHEVEQVLLSSEPYRFGPEHVALAQALCPRARVRCVDGELLSWWGVRALPGLAYLEALADAPA